MPSYWEEPFLTADNDRADGIFKICSFFFVGGLILTVADTLRIAWREKDYRYDDRKIRKRLDRYWKYEVYFFLGMAVVAFWLVNGQKLPWKQTMRLMKKSLQQQPESGTEFAGIEFGEIADRARTWFRKVMPGITKEQFIPQVVYDAFEKDKWFAADWDQVDSLWDCFKMLVTTYRRFWWTQQWFMGYTAWTLFVAMECRFRDIPESAIFSFAILGYLFGLACAQFVFYALLVLKPRVHSPYWIPDSAVSIITSLAEAAGVALLPFIVPGVKGAPNVVFNTLQAFLIVQLPLLHSLATYWRYVLIQKANAWQTGKQWLHVVWFTISVASAALYLHSIVMAYRETDVENPYGWHRLGAVGWRDPTKHYRNATIVQDTTRSVFGSFGDHVWISALGVDVLLSGFGLCCWAVVNSSDAGSMVKCSLFPWLDEAYLMAEHAGEQIRDTTEELYDDFCSSERLARAKSALSPATEKLYDMSMSQPVVRAKSALPTATDEARRRTVSAYQNFTDRLDDYDEEYGAPRPTKALRGRPPLGNKKSSANSTTTAHSTRRTRSASASSARSKSRGRANVSPVKKAVSRKRSSSRLRDMVNDHTPFNLGDDDGEGIFSPTVEAVKDMAEEAEAAGLSVALFAIGGLGMASAAVFGAQELGQELGRAFW
ncbi:hypothetical protein LTR37_006067 [Vermiconidia calcicola]|uniref:Uncharacterized protein n=1 Tax=Vermiconidia calcicola TaxID=1690605 RepID=A0ACC3NK90_9PEZI|nr:hypothetical protein LTR37_006067 [Vermiconidia calcicola]